MHGSNGLDTDSLLRRSRSGDASAAEQLLSRRRQRLFEMVAGDIDFSKQPEYARTLEWYLTTCPAEHLRNPAKAVDLAKSATTDSQAEDTTAAARQSPCQLLKPTDQQHQISQEPALCHS